MTTHLYIRVSTNKQDFDRQYFILNENGYNKSNSVIHTETYSGKTINDRPVLSSLLSEVKANDIIVIESLSRLARSLKDLLSIIELLEEKNVTLKSIKEQIDLTSAVGKMMLSIMGAFNQFERDIISERTSEKLQAMKAEGVELGRPKEYDHQAIIKFYLSDRGITYDDIATKFGISKGQVSNIMKSGNIKKKTRRIAR